MSGELERQLVAEHSPDCESYAGETAPIVIYEHHQWPDGPNLMTVACCDGALSALQECRCSLAQGRSERLSFPDMEVS